MKNNKENNELLNTMLTEKKVSFRVKIILITIIPPVIALLVSIIFAVAQDFIGYTTMIIVIFFLTIILFEVVFIKLILLNETTTNFIIPKLKDAFSERRMDGRPALQAGSIIFESELAEFERTYPNCENAEIWIISNDLTPDLCGGPYVDIVPTNVSRGIKYKIFIAKSNTAEAKIVEMRMKNNDSKNIEFYVLNDDFFFLVSRFDFTIYDPYGVSSIGKLGYIGLDLPNQDELVAAKVDNKLTDAIISKLISQYRISIPHQRAKKGK
jgi:hypothetical protein